MSLSIQHITIAETTILAKVARQSYREHYLQLWHDTGAWYIKKCFTPRQLRKEISNPNSLFYFALWNDTPIGFLKLNINATYRTLENKNCLELERIYLLKAAKGKGIGKALINFTLNYAQSINKEIVFLKTMDSIDTIEFYKKMGFQTFATHRLTFPLMKEELRGMYIMKHILTQM